MESDDNVSGEFQRSTRMPLDAVVRLHFQGTVAYQNGFAANVSATGMFVKHPAPPPLGTQLVFEFNLGPERKPVQGAGEVVWVRDKYLGPGQPAGVGIRFLQLDSQSRDHIAEALFEYLEQSLSEDSVLDSSGYSYLTEPDPPAAPAAASPFASPVTAGRTEPFAGGDLDDIYSTPAARSAEPPAAAGPFDFAALERLPGRDGAASPPPERQTDFSSFAPLDDTSFPTVSLSRPAAYARPEANPPSGVRVPFSDAAPLAPMAQMAPMAPIAPPPSPALPMMGAAASSEKESSRSWLGVLLVVVLLGGGGYFAWNQWGAPWWKGRQAPAASSKPDLPAPEPKRQPEPLPAATAPETTLAETVGVDPRAVSPAAAPPQTATSVAPASQTPDEATEEPSDVAAARETNDAPPAAEPARPTERDAAREAVTAAPRPPAAAAPSETRASRLTGIEWQGGASGETAVLLAGDGAFAAGSFSYSELRGENPRVLVKLRGMESPYRGATPRGTGPLVRGVRTGFHATSSGNEVHVVVDLARAGVKVLALEPDGTALRLTLAP